MLQWGFPETAAWAFIREAEFAERKTLAIPTRASSLEGYLHLPSRVGAGMWAAKVATWAAVSLASVSGFEGGCLEEC